MNMDMERYATVLTLRSTSVRKAMYIVDMMRNGMLPQNDAHTDIASWE